MGEEEEEGRKRHRGPSKCPIRSTNVEEEKKTQQSCPIGLLLSAPKTAPTLFATAQAAREGPLLTLLLSVGFAIVQGVLLVHFFLFFFCFF